jgi:ATP-binding cassette subfamily F protein uup
LDGQGAAESLASLEQWEAWRKSRDKPKAGKRSVPKLAASPDPKRLLNGRERNELRTIEASISAAEAKAKTARQALADPAIAADASALLERHRLLEEAEAQVAGLFKRWEALEAKRRLEE